MIRKKRRRSFVAAEDAGSVVIGFVLIMGILLASVALVLSQQVPGWTKEFEAEHASKLVIDFADISATIDNAVLSEDPTSPAACPIGMKPKTNPLVGIHGTGGMLRFDSAEERFACIACAPEETEDAGSGSWSTTDFLHLANDSFHVKVTS